ncbi:MAG: hypothetical protein JWQ39_1779 [Glaciihabitans sp.]|jgi:uncharacterized protein YdhG (YjbR/CyaY superfamily)|nr:hypothetical protein [Glaciihabitans sp.]
MADKKASESFTAEEKAAMRQRAKELKENATRDEDAKAVLDAIAAMKPADRAIAERVHAVVIGAAPQLAPKTWYGMPAYALDGKIVCSLKPSDKFKERYSTFGFNDPAQLDDGTMWPVSFAITSLSAANEKQIAALVTKAVG